MGVFLRNCCKKTEIIFYKKPSRDRLFSQRTVQKYLLCWHQKKSSFQNILQVKQGTKYKLIVQGFRFGDFSLLTSYKSYLKRGKAWPILFFLFTGKVILPHRIFSKRTGEGRTFNLAQSRAIFPSVLVWKLLEGQENVFYKLTKQDFFSPRGY